ncbi:hypothetical protein ASC77_12585 [Nocardioides sp. Root1257]|uniref:DUF305 domain-containing protein n=1 Tax=unclassified Nocardioides TaxID=2615069 RepID=UPI0006FBEF83|nr:MULTISPECIES: DUF305 domain-containing protein [unclassified Nocardioides]KQW47307.1 hypothetical protein ASC77_12585 [Nocardioides sp. Root1257]KRC45463.1 hypothetical protein ASE24_12590 [Nocardioides sp. Root224]
MDSYTHTKKKHPVRRSRTVRRVAAAVALTTALGVTLAACGDDSDGGSPSSTQTASNGDVFNDADVSFASDMIQHHAQALSMVDLTQGRTLDPEVQQLADDIQAAQGPEIETMADWLTAWGEDVPATMRDHSNAGHDMGGDMSEQMEGMESSDMPGMMSADEMNELQDASDAEFQDMWLEMMVRHHKGAVEMAQTEQEDGTFADAVELAKAIETAQNKEIAQMEGLLG